MCLLDRFLAKVRVNAERVDDQLVRIGLLQIDSHRQLLIVNRIIYRNTLRGPNEIVYKDISLEFDSEMSLDTIPLGLLESKRD